MQSNGNAHQIFSNLWIGNENSARDVGFLRKYNITAVVNASKAIPNFYETQENNGIKYFRVPVNDTLKLEDFETMLKWLPSVLRFIRMQHRLGKNVLVHCAAGQQRSAGIVVAYLMFFYNMTLENSIKYVRMKRPIAFLYGMHVNFMPALKEFSRRLNILNSS